MEASEATPPAWALEKHRAVLDLRQLDLSWQEHGKQVRRQLALKVIEKKQGWALVASAYQDWDHAKSRWKDLDIRLIRLVRRAGAWRVFSHFPIRRRQAEALGGALAELCLDASLRSRSGTCSSSQTG